MKLEAMLKEKGVRMPRKGAQNENKNWPQEAANALLAMRARLASHGEEELEQAMAEM